MFSSHKEMAMWVWILVTVVVVLILIGVGIAWWWYSTGCSANADCGAGLLCSEGRCVAPSCRTSADCPPDRPICNGVCQAKPPCTNNSNCAAGEVCSTASRQCVSPQVVETIVQVSCADTTATVTVLTDDTVEAARMLFPGSISVGRYVVFTTCSQQVGDELRPAYNWFAEVTAVPSSYSTNYITLRRMRVLTYGEVYRDENARASYTITGFSARGQAIFTVNP